MAARITIPKYHDNTHPSYLPLCVLRPHMGAWRYIAHPFPKADAGVSPDDLEDGRLYGEEFYQRIAEDVQRIAEYFASQSDPYYSVQNDGIGEYEYWGAIEIDHGRDYIHIEGNRDDLPQVRIDLPKDTFQSNELRDFLEYIDVELTSCYPSKELTAQAGMNDELTATAQLRAYYSLHITPSFGTMQLEITFTWHDEED